MRDTPKTDALYDELFAFVGEDEAVAALASMRDFARTLERDRADLLVIAKSLVMVWGDKFSPQSLRTFNEIEARILNEKGTP